MERFTFFAVLITTVFLTVAFLHKFSEYDVSSWYSTSASVSTPHFDNAIAKSAESITLFLTWTKYFGADHKFNLLLFKRCPELNCVMTLNRSLASKSRAILFYMTDMDWQDLPDRKIDQYFIFQMWESPVNRPLDLSSSGRGDFFNMSFTYRLDSTVPSRYGAFEKLVWPPIINDSLISADQLEGVARKKKKLVAWFVSNCKSDSGREKFVEKLKSHVRVDIYGDCGPFKCPRDYAPRVPGFRGATACERMITEDYKFYMALENSLCRDYVTEKFYRIMERTVVVPIVMERKLLLDTVHFDKDASHALNKSVIAVDDFPDAQTFGNYLKYLDGNFTAYMEFYEWRQKFQVLNDDATQSPGCELCRFVKQKKTNIITDLGKWWHEEAYCHRQF